MCFFIFEGNWSTADHLFLTEEEVTTGISLHAHGASLNYQDLITHTHDTDVFILAVTMWLIRIFIKTGKQNNLML